MLIKVRSSVFETNSSSCHAISVNKSSEWQTIESQEDIIPVSFADYGWGYEVLQTPLEKLSYVLTSLQYYEDLKEDFTMQDILDTDMFKWLCEAVLEHTGKRIFPMQQNCTYDPFGYVDHESTDLLDEILVRDKDAFKKNVIELIFNSKSYIVIANDNCDYEGVEGFSRDTRTYARLWSF